MGDRGPAAYPGHRRSLPPEPHRGDRRARDGAGGRELPAATASTTAIVPEHASDARNNATPGFDAAAPCAAAAETDGASTGSGHSGLKKARRWLSIGPAHRPRTG